jgi:CheY-like chemotaxis protein
VIVLEGDATTRDWLVRLLGQARYAAEGVAGLDELVARCQVKSFAAVVLDPLHPAVRSGEVLPAVRGTALNQDTVLVAVSASAAVGGCTGFLLQDYLAKPVLEESLVGSFRRALGSDLQKTVLVIDDDPAALTLARAALTSLQCSALCVSSAEEGLRVAESTQPALIVLDLSMAGMDGFEFITEFHRTRRGRSVPILIWTAKTLSAEEEARLRRSAAAIVAKGQRGIAEVIEQLRALLGTDAAVSRGG